MLVRDFKEQEGYRFPQEFLDILPEWCLDDRCESPTEMTEALTSLRCSNPRCPSKIVKRITAIMSMLGVKDLGQARASDFVSKFGVSNPLIIFAYEPAEDGELGYSISMDVSKKISDQIQKKKTFALWEYVRVANLPFIQGSASKIFGDYDDLELAYKDIEENGVDFIRNKLEIKKGGNNSNLSLGVLADDLEIEPENMSIRAIKVFESLMTFKQDLFAMLPFVNIISLNSDDMITIKAVCSEEVGKPFATKADFYSTVNSLYPNIHVEFMSSVTKAIDYLVWAGADGNANSNVTNKVKKARDYNAKYDVNKQIGRLKDDDHIIKIVTASEFLGVLQGLSGKELD